jgi:hypothetical protein
LFDKLYVLIELDDRGDEEYGIGGKIVILERGEE